MISINEKKYQNEIIYWFHRQHNIFRPPNNVKPSNDTTDKKEMIICCIIARNILYELHLPIYFIIWHFNDKKYGDLLTKSRRNTKHEMLTMFTYYIQT